MMNNYYNLLEENRNILIVDTSLVITNKLKQRLKEFNFNVFIANDIETVYKYLEEDYIPFFGIICEVDMPRIDDKIAFLKYLINKCAIIIVLSSSDNETFIHEVLNYDVVDYILKSKEEDLIYAAEMMSRIHRYKKYKILLIEHELENQEKIKKYLEALMLKVIISNCEQQTLDLLDRYDDICLVLINNNLEDITINELILQIRKKYSKDDLNIVAVVPKDNHEASSRVLKNGVNAYVSDDLTKESVCLVINNLLDVYENKLITNKTKDQIQEYTSKLSKYISPQIYQSIINDIGNEKVKSQSKKLTIFFSDIVNFTGTTESLESEELTLMLNNYLTVMSEIALKYGATIDKFIGDAVMVFFGDPFSKGIKEDAISCVQMAIEMQNRMESFREEQKINGVLNPFHIRCGIATGTVIVGNFGSANRMDYTILGKFVNLAATLEAACAHDEILVSEETYLQIKKSIQAEKRDNIKVSGFHEEIHPFEIIRTKTQDELSNEINIKLKASLKNMDLNNIVLDFDTKKLLNTIQEKHKNKK